MTPDLLHELLQAGIDDWVSLDDAAWILTQEEHSVPASKECVLISLHEVFRDALMAPGELGESGFEDWPGSHEEWNSRAREELEHLAWPPLGAGFWLRLTDRGRTRLVD